MGLAEGEVGGGGGGDACICVCVCVRACVVNLECPS